MIRLTCGCGARDVMCRNADAGETQYNTETRQQNIFLIIIMVKFAVWGATGYSSSLV